LTVNEQTHFDDFLLSGSLLVLTFSTGVVDAASFLALGHVFTAKMTGNVAAHKRVSRFRDHCWRWLYVSCLFRTSIPRAVAHATALSAS